MKTESPGAFAAHLSWPEVERRIKAGAVAVLPVGAACKAHGPHLPMNTDMLQAEWLAAALVQRADELETSILLAVGREHVALDKAETWIPPAMAARGPFSRNNPDNPRFSPSGVWGDPTLASEDKGHRLLAAMVDDLLAAVETLQGEQQ
jgi:creatinine amidohydrolase/Fe(II)-dependent formamide hydrolase-like protein